MVAEAPPFWWRPRDWRAYLLFPISAAYGAVARSRMDMVTPPTADLPVLCVGNLTVGGSGKTPVAIALARTAGQMGFKPGFLSRGHGGNLSKPHLVDLQQHSAWHCGDEPLLLAAAAPTAVAVNRKIGADMLIAQGCDFAIMDDGFQSARLHFDFALIVVDAERGIGNGHVIPGGPLRAPLTAQLRHASAVVTTGSGEAGDPVIRQAAQAGKPLFSVETTVVDAKKYADRRCLAFAGIGNPKKFFDTLRACGAEVVSTMEFGDHHSFTEAEMTDLAAQATDKDLTLITTEKDAARLINGNAAATAFLSKIDVLRVTSNFEPPAIAERIIRDTVDSFKRNRFGG